MISSMPFMLLLAVCAAASGQDGQACDAQKETCPDLVEHGTDVQIALQSRVDVSQHQFVHTEEAKNTLKFASLEKLLHLERERKKVETKSRATKLKLAQDVNYPPYASKNPKTGELEGFGHDIANGLNAMCDNLDIEVVQTLWQDCWTPHGLGAKLESGEIDACMTYTHTKGMRNEFADFSWGILDVNKAAGLMSKLENGQPKVTGHDDLAGKTVADVAGWAPTADGLDFVKNKCTGKHYSPQYNLMMAGSSANNNDLALDWLLDGKVDAVFLYSDQAKNYKKACYQGVADGWNCKNWKQFGKQFAYVQTGQFGYVNNGTTLALAKKGSGVPEKLNPCLQKFMESQAYYDVCVKFDFVDSCYPNSFFPGAGQIEVHDYNKPTDEHEGDCSTGYCPCT